MQGFSIAAGMGAGYLPEVIRPVSKAFAAMEGIRWQSQYIGNNA
jgi:hypothetical protein